MKIVPHSRPWISAADRAAVDRVLRSGQLAGGREVVALEEELARATGYRHAVAVSSGTAGLHLALTVLGLDAATEVVLPSYACVSLAHAVTLAGAVPRLADVAPGAFHPSPEELRAATTAGTGAVLLPHLFGYEACDQGLAGLDLPVVDDLAMGLGLPRHSGRTGQLAVYSFYATKLLAAGEGGLVATDSVGLARELQDRRAYDKRSDHKQRFNYKLSDLAAALVRSQLERLAENLERRRRIARRYRRKLGGCPGVELPPDTPGALYYRFVIRSRRPLGKLIRRYAELGVEWPGLFSCRSTAVSGWARIASKTPNASS